MSKFYSEISKYYDDIFPVGKEEIKFIAENAGEPPKKIFDVACGAGEYSKKLSDMGYLVTAIDLDEKMVGKLKEKDKNINARVLNMLNINDLSETYDLIFCIGNSLVHLDNLKEITIFLKSCKNKLLPNGKLIIQIVNFNRILGKGVKELPVIKKEDKKLTFKRYYNYLPGQNKVDFMTVLTVDGKQMENHELLFPIKSDELQEVLETAGFSKIKLYGNFKKDEYKQLESFPLVVVAE